MFGTLRIRKDLLDDEERRLYRAAFCAGCHALHDLCGRPAALLVNYDQTVLALLLAGLGPERAAEPRACTAWPLRTVDVAPLDGRAAALLAALDVGAVEAKLRDDVQDGDRPLLKRAALRLLRGPHARARDALRALGFPVSILDGLPARQSAIEHRRGAAIDELAAPSAELTAQVFAHAGLAVGRLDLAPALAEFGAALGAWVYAFDAWRDLGDDVRLGRFNAWVAAGVVEPAAIARHLERAVERAGTARRLLPLGAHGAVIGALLESLRVRGGGVARSARIASSRDHRQAGDCDCSCCEAGCGDAGCCESGGAAVDGSSCTGCDVCCDAVCCWATAPSRERRAVRRAGRARIRGEDLAQVDLSPLVGAEGTAATDLLPHGRVTVRGLEFDAVADTGMIDRGARVVVRGVERGRLHVERASR